MAKTLAEIEAEKALADKIKQADEQKRKEEEARGQGDIFTPPNDATAPKAGITEEEAIRRVEKARREEKDKLYAQLEAEKAKQRTIELDMAKLTAQLEEMKASASGKSEVEARLKEAQDKQSELVLKLNLIQEQYETKIKEYEDKTKKIELDAYRERVIREAGNKILPELVTGDSKEAIDNSVAKARQRYAEIEEQVKTGKIVENKNTPPPPGLDGNPGNRQNVKQADELTFEELSKLSPEERERIRYTERKKAEQEFKQSTK